MRLYIPILLVLLFCARPIQTKNLVQTVLHKMSEPDSLITKVEQEAIDTQKEKMTIRVAGMALISANADEKPANVVKNKECYALHTNFKNNPQKAVEELPDFETESAIFILNNAIALL